MRQTVKTVAHAPMKLSEPLLIGMLVMMLVGFNVAAGTRSLGHIAPSNIQVSSIDD